MRQNKALYQLIHSMTASEKRFFKVQAGRHVIGEKNNYVRLFELFNQMGEFDDEAIEKSGKRAKYIKHFAAEKYQLYNSLLDSLDVYHKASSVDRQISKLINQGRILLEKKLEEHAEKILEKAKKLSVQQNRHENLITINQLLMRKAFDKETMTVEFLEERHEEAFNAVKRIERKLFFRHAFDQLLLTRRTHGDISDKAFIGRLVKTFPHLVESIPAQSVYWDSDVYYFLSRLEFCRLSRKREEGRTMALKLLALLEGNRSMITGEFIDRYSYALYVFIIIHAYNSEEEKELALHKLRNLDRYIDVKVTKREHARTFEYHYTTLTDIYLKNKEYHKIKASLPDFERAEAIYIDHVTPSFNIALYYNIAALFFGMGEYRQALKWGNKISMAALTLRKDIYHYLRTLNLIIHMELENYDSLKSVMSSITYFNKKHRIKSELQKSLMRHVNKLFKAATKEQEQKVFYSLREDLLRLKDVPTENSIYEDLDLIAWINGKCKI